MLKIYVFAIEKKILKKILVLFHIYLLFNKK